MDFSSQGGAQSSSSLQFSNRCLPAFPGSRNVKRPILIANYARRRPMHRSGLLAALTLALFTTIGFAQDSAPLKVGLLLPFTGNYAWVGANVQPVAKMIAGEVNEAGGIGGRSISLVTGDAQGTVDAGYTAAQKLVNVDGVLAVVGPTSLAFAGAQQVLLDN